MKTAAIVLGCLVAFAGGWGGILLASLFTAKAGAGWSLSRYAMLSIVVAALLGVLAGSAFNVAISQSVPAAPEQEKESE